MLFIERKDRAKPGYEYIKTSIGGKPVSLNGHVSRPNKHVYLGYARAITNSFTDGVTAIHQTSSKRDDSVSFYLFLGFETCFLCLKLTCCVRLLSVELINVLKCTFM